MTDTPEQYRSPSGTPDALVVRVPAEGYTRIRMGSELTVRPDEVAVLRVGDHVGDLLGSGQHVIGTRTVPIVTRALALPYGSGSAFEGAFYFLRTRRRAVERWGTPSPVAFLDNMFGATRVRAHGAVVFRVTNPRVFLRAMGEEAASGALGPRLSALIASRFADALAERVDTLIDLQRYQEELRTMVTARLETDFEVRGMMLVHLTIETMTLPREVMETIESRGAVGSVRQLREFVREETTRSLAAADVETAEAATASTIEDEPMSEPEPERSHRCGACHSMLADDALFCARCGEPREVLATCLFCGGANPIDARFCCACGESIDGAATCTACTHPSPPGAHYCSVCGHAMSAPAERKRA
jgi:membrane protease subunit (stomatin/prohibitin family)